MKLGIELCKGRWRDSLRNCDPCYLFCNLRISPVRRHISRKQMLQLRDTQALCCPARKHSHDQPAEKPCPSHEMLARLRDSEKRLTRNILLRDAAGRAARVLSATRNLKGEGSSKGRVAGD